MTQILMVCSANICRSPMAQMVGTHLAEKAGMGKQVRFDSAGTQAGGSSEPADPRTTTSLAKRNYAIGKTRSRRITANDFTRFDLILAMDHSHMDAMRAICPAVHLHKLHLLLDFAPQQDMREVPDPYFGNPQGFDKVLDLCEVAVIGLIDQIRSGAIVPTQTL